MTYGEMFIGTSIVLTTWFWALLFARLKRVEYRLAYLSDRMGTVATREEVASIRTNLTHIALVVGADRPRAGEG